MSVVNITNAIFLDILMYITLNVMLDKPNSPLRDLFRFIKLTKKMLFSDLRSPIRDLLSIFVIMEIKLPKVTT